MHSPAPMSDTVVSSALARTRCTARIAVDIEDSFSTETVSESGAAGIAKRPISEHIFVVNMVSHHRFIRCEHEKDKCEGASAIGPPSVKSSQDGVTVHRRQRPRLCIYTVS